MLHQLVLIGLSLLPYVQLQSAPLPPADGTLHIRSLPIGQGDALIIQCPSGDLAVYDWGSSNAQSSQFWAATELRNYLAGNMNLIKNIVVTHQHADHYDLLPDTFPDLAELSALENIYISCTFADTATTFSNWINAIGANSLLREFNNGGQCGPQTPSGPVPSCEAADLCPNDPAVVTEVMGANLGQHCTDGGNKNTDCIVTKLTYGQFSILLPGDFEDDGTSENEDGPQKWMADFYGSQLNVIVNHIAHHGAATYANKLVWVDAIQAPLVWASGDAWYSYGHPRCEAVESYKRYLCEPLQTDSSSPDYCGDQIGVPQLQQTYTCGNTSDIFTEVNDNTKGIYTNVPVETEMHIVDVRSDGATWGISYSTEPATP